MEAPKSPKRGRPPRDPAEVVRVITWYYAVREISKLSETKLEIEFDKLDRVAQKKHRGSRWNKYKSGVSNPGAELVLAVEREYNGTKAIYEHPVWALASKTNWEQPVLKTLLEALPPGIARIFVCKDVPAATQFWMQSNIDYEFVLALMTETAKDSRSVHNRLSCVACVLALIEFARIHHLEDMHFECHHYLARTAEQWYPPESEVMLQWRLESAVMDRWLDTEYTNNIYRHQIAPMRIATVGPRPPWTPQQTSLRFGKNISKKETADMQNGCGYWAVRQMALLPTAEKKQETR
jgi:hypothetical protein